VGIITSTSAALQPARIERIAHLEQLFEHAPMRHLGHLPVEGVHTNGTPSLVEVWDDAAGAWERAIYKPATAQLPQETFAWRAIGELRSQDLFATTVARHDPLDGYLVEFVDGLHPEGLTEAKRGLRIRHEHAARPDHEAQVDLHRMLGIDYVLANPDRHDEQMKVAHDGLLAFDQGLIGGLLTRTGDPLVVPFDDTLLGAAGVGATKHQPGVFELEPEAVARLLDDARSDEIAAAHAATLGSWDGPVNSKVQKTSAFAASQEYLDGVLARIEHLNTTGTILHVNARTLT